jgi:hypothetical protein
VDPRLGYLGDWHSHPADIGPSSVDSASMRRLGADVDAGCTHPVLIIARRRGPGIYSFDARQLARWGLRRLRLIAAGGLPLFESNRRVAQ